jgi:GPH family glycoside/pentoside/hexuronide:cation symporter
MMIGRIVDALTDPLIAQWSDRTRSRWGRRIPFILFGSLPLVLSFILVWNPPVPGSSVVNFTYLVLTLGLFFLFYTIVIVPYSALLPELTLSSKERISLATWQGFFRILGLIIGFLGSSFLIERMGFKAMATILGMVVLVCLYCPVLVVKERNVHLKKSEFTFRQSIIQTFRNKPFRYYIGGYIFFWFAFTLLIIGISYIVTELMGLDKGDVGLIVTPLLVAVLLSFPLIQRIASKKGKKFTMLLSLTLLCAVFFLLPSIGHWPFGISRVLQGQILLGLAGIPVATLFVLPNAMIADLVDYDENLTGSRREAMYFGMQGLMTKFAIALSFIVSGFLFRTFGYSAAAPLGILLLGPVAGVFVLAGLLIFRKYPITT